MSEPSNSELSRQIEEGFRVDTRLRTVEQEIAALRLLPKEIQRMEDRLVEAIAKAKPNPWPIVAAMAAVAAVLLAVASQLYGQ